MRPVSDRLRRRLVDAASAARVHAYAPYSKFLVGAAALDERGRIFAGCNVENASYGLTVCAEPIAIFSAIAAGAKRIRAIAVVLKSDEPCAPCGHCRQIIYEFGRDAEVILANVGRKGYEVIPIKRLLPRAFGPDTL